MRVPSLSLARLVLPALVALSAGACLGDPFEDRPLEIDVVPEEEVVTLGDSVVVEVFVQGQDLVRVEIDWADGSDQSFGAEGAVEFRRREAHLYDEPGVYEVEGAAEDFAGGRVTATTTVEVTAQDGS